jgi:7,8-dihydropterin-6-yl-methyl-4-(beta-D-ribofuranosyl)aminobenzene 5'-phosphate synthase
MKTVKGCLTILADNIVTGKVEGLGEHGFSVYIETDTGNYLFDTGWGKTIVYNAMVYKKNLGALDKIILSHGHPDHTGGLPEVLRFHDQIDVLGHPDIFLYRFRKEPGGKSEYGGIPYTRGYLEKMGARLVFNQDFSEMEKGIYLTGEVPRETDFEAGDLDNRYGIRDGKVVPEIILDDQSLIITTDGGILILLGCAHAGIINIINHAVKMTGVDTIFGLIGGTHLGFSGPGQLEKTVSALKAYHIQHFIPGHCTGIAVATRLRCEFEKIFQFSHVGMVFEF